jgi:hypothetical protein
MEIVRMSAIPMSVPVPEEKRHRTLEPSLRAMPP